MYILLSESSLWQFKETTKLCSSPSVWLRSSVGKRAQLVSGKHGFDSRRSLNLFAQTSFLQFTSEHHCFPWVDSFKKIWMGRAIWTGSASKSVCILFCFFYYSISRSVAKQLSKSCDMLWYLGAKVSKGWSLNSWQPIQSKFS